MNSVRVMSIAASVALICAGSVESRIRNVGLPDCFAECQRQHFRPKARSAHAEQEHIRESRALHVLRKRLVIGDLLEAQIDAVEPAQPLVLVGARPYRFVPPPQAAHDAARTPNPRWYPSWLFQARGRAFKDSVSLPGVHQLIGGIDEQLHAFLGQLVGHCIERNAGSAPGHRARAARLRCLPVGCRGFCHGRGTRRASREAWC